MEQIIITHKSGTTLKLNSKENASAITKASQTVELLGADVVDISVQSAKKLSFLIGDKITVIGRDYTLNTPARERKVAENNFQYDMQFEGVQYDLLRATFNVNVNTTNNTIQDISGDSITGNVKTFLDIIVSNANRVFGTGKWAVGTYPVGSKTISLTFNDSDNCLTVLQNICGEENFNTEFKIAIDGSGNRTINVGATGTNFTTTFEYGKGKGIYELTREKLSSSNIITRLNCFGGSKNIITPKYRASKLCLATKSKSQSFIEDATAISTYGVWEASKDFEDVYPHRTGVISALGTTVFELIDSSMNFDLNEKNVDGTTKYLMAGTSAKIHFNTGNLAGYEFEVAAYDNTTKKFTIISQTDQNDYVFPSTTSTAFRFAVGDEYIISDIYMPQAYIDTAESELATKAAAYLAKYSQPLVQYGLTLDSNFLKNQVGADAASNIIWVGDYIPIKDTDLDVNKTIRVKGFTRDLMFDYMYQLTIADLSVTVSVINRVMSGMNTVDKIVKINNLNDPAKARRNWKDSQEVLNMIFDTEGDFYTDKIKPLSIETTMLSVGSKSMQFGLEGTIFQPNYAGAKNRVVYTGGILTHYAILDTAGNPIVWNITDGDVTMTSDTARYVYAKCSKTGTGATMLFSASKITVDSDVSYYHFLLGMLNSVDVNNTRALALTYGFTTVNGRFIKTGRIQSADGVTYFDLDAGEFKGNFKFTSGTSVETAVTAAQTQANTATTNAATAQTTANTAVANAATAQTAANNAQTAANTAQTSANTANTEISNISSDNVLSPLEKSGERNRWNIISAEKSAINTQATTFVITTENAAYNTAFQNLANYLNAGTTWTSGIPSWISDANLGTNTTIVGSTYRTTWEAFYASRQTLMNAISAKAKTLADTAQTQANTATTNAATAQTTANTATTNAATAQTAATNAATAASNAQTSANTANSAITDISNDDKITPSEKQAMKLEWDSIVSEKTKNDTQADSFAVSKTAYGTAYTTLSTYIGTNLNDLTTTWSLEVGGGATMRSYFKGYYDARTDLLNAIATKAKATADAIQVGGRNLLIGSSNGTGWTNYVSGSTFAATAASTGESNYIYSPYFTLKGDQIITLSFESKEDAIINSRDLFILPDNYPSIGLLSTVFSKNADWTKVTLVFTTPTGWGTGASVKLRIDHNGSTTGASATIYARNIKLELGNKATDWTPAPEDIDTKIATAQTQANTATANAASAASAASTAQSAANNAAILASAAQNSGMSIVGAIETWASSAGHIVTISDGVEGNVAVRMGAGAGFIDEGNYHPIDTTRKYKTRFWARSGAGTNGVLYHDLRQFTDNIGTPCATNGGRSPYWPASSVVPTSWTLYEHTWDISDWQSGVKYIIPEWLGNYSGTTGYIEIQGYKLYDVTEVTAAQAKADSADYLKAAMGANTAIEGGLLSTSLIQVKDVNGNVTGGLSGLASDNIVMFGGGTYADALASASTPSAVAVIDRKDGSGHRAKGALLWDYLGNLSVGLFKIIAGAWTGYEGLYERIRITTASITPLATLVAGGWIREATDYKVTNGYAGTIYNSDSTSSHPMTSTYRVSASLIIPATTNVRMYSGGALSYTLVNPTGISFTSITEKFEISGLGQYTLTTGGNTTVSVPAGSYTISYIIEAVFQVGALKSSLVTFSNTSAAWAEVQSVAPSRTEIGSNGLFSFWSTTQYFFYDKINGLQVKGVMDIPGVLATGSIGSAGAHTNRWGAKSSTSNATYTATGIYDVIHTLGSTAYTVMIQPTVDGNNAFIISKSTTSFRVQIRNNSGTAAAGAFDYTITGTN